MYKINEHNIKYNFFKDFSDINSKFLVSLNTRKQYIKDKLSLNDEELLKSTL